MVYIITPSLTLLGEEKQGGVKMKVHILKLSGDGTIAGVYADKAEAERVADKTNKTKSWQRITQRMAGHRWIVHTFGVQERGRDG